MSSDAYVPYADPEPVSEIVEECRCVEGECAAHGIDLHPGHHAAAPHPSEPVVIDDSTQGMVDELFDPGM